MQEGYHIALDLQALYTAHATRGIGNYVRELLNEIIRIDDANVYYLINFYGEIPAEEKIKSRANVYEVNCYDDVKDHLTEENKEFYFRSIIRKIIKQNAIDIWLAGAVVDPYNLYSASCFNDTRFVTIAYDLIPLVFGKNYLKDIVPARAYIRWFEQYLYSEYVFSISETTKKDLVELIGVDACRIKTIYAGVVSLFHKKTYSDVLVEEKKRELGINNDYLFCVGADDFRKNLDGLVHAYLDMKTELISEYQLVITCAISRETITRIKEYEKKKGWENRIVITGFVNDEDMLFLINNAKLAVFPSMYEGFGFPVVEAWRCEVPVLTSNNSSLGEIANQAAICVDPFSVKEIRDGMELALTQPEQDLSKLVLRGKREGQNYTWEKVAKIVIASYDEIMKVKKINTMSLTYKKQLRKLQRACLKHVGPCKRLSYAVANIRKY